MLLNIRVNIEKNLFSNHIFSGDVDLFSGQIHFYTSKYDPNNMLDEKKFIKHYLYPKKLEGPGGSVNEN